MRSRKVGCMGPGMTPVQDDYCKPSSQPQSHQPCKRAPCHYMWITGEWSQVGIKDKIEIKRLRFVLTATTVSFLPDTLLYTTNCFSLFFIISGLNKGRKACTVSQMVDSH